MSQVPPSSDSLKIQKKVVAHCLQSKTALSKCVDKLKPDYFTGSYKKIVNAAFQYYKLAKDVVTFDIIERNMKRARLVSGKRKYSSDDIVALQLIYEECEDYPVRLNEFEGHLKFFLDDLYNRMIQNALSDDNDGVLELIRVQDGLAAFKRMEQVVHQIKNLESLGDGVTKGFIDERADDFWKRYQYKKENPGARHGLLTGFYDFDVMTGGIQDGEMVVIGGRIGCLSEDSLIPVQNGQWKTIRDIVENKRDHIYSLNSDWQSICNQPIDFLYSGQQHVYRVTTESGFSLESTDHHRYLCFNDKWQQLSELQKGDWIALNRELLVEEKYCKSLSCDDLVVLSYIIAEGGCTVKYRLGFTNGDKNIVKEMKEISSKYGAELKPWSKKCPYTYRIQNCRKIKNMLKTHGINNQYSYEKFIPELIFSLPKKQLALFLGRLWSCDGSLWNSRYCVSFGTASKRLTQDVQKLLLRFGIWSRYKERENTHKGAYEITISDKDNLCRFLEYIGPYIIGDKQFLVQKYQKDLMQIKANPNKDLIPKSVWKTIEQERKRKNIPWNKTISQKRAYRNLTVLRKINPSRIFVKNVAEKINSEKLQKIANSNIYWDRIKSIEYIGVRHTYDLKFDERLLGCEPNFVANNFIVHNSGKSVSILAMAANIYKGGMIIPGLDKPQKPKNVMLVSIEMPIDQYERRFYSAIAQVPSQHVKTGQLSLEDEKKLEDAKEMTKNHSARFYIVDRPLCTPAGLEAELQEAMEKFDPDVIIVDYLGIMKSDEPSRSDWEEQGRVVVALRNIGRTHKKPIITAVQLNRDPNKNKDRSTQRLSRSDMIGQTADTVLQIGEQDDEDKIANMDPYIRYYTIKIRDGSPVEYFDMCTDLSRMQIYDIKISGQSDEEVEDDF